MSWTEKLSVVPLSFLGAGESGAIPINRNSIYYLVKKVKYAFTAMKIYLD